jgi:hypothetical protein
MMNAMQLCLSSVLIFRSHQSGNAGLECIYDRHRCHNGTVFSHTSTRDNEDNVTEEPYVGRGGGCDHNELGVMLLGGQRYLMRLCFHEAEN